MTNTKLCSECSNNQLGFCSVFTVASKYTPSAPTERTVIEARENELLCGKDGKHFEPIGGADI